MSTTFYLSTEISLSDLRIYAEIISQAIGYSFDQALEFVSQKTHIIKAMLTDRSVIVGFCSYTEEENLSTHQPTYYLEDLDVLKDYRRQGVGSALVKYVEQIACTQQISTLSLHTGTKKQENLDFFSTLGFHTRVLVPGYYQAKFDAYLLTKELEGIIEF